MADRNLPVARIVLVEVQIVIEVVSHISNMKNKGEYSGTRDLLRAIQNIRSDGIRQRISLTEKPNENGMVGSLIDKIPHAGDRFIL